MQDLKSNLNLIKQEKLNKIIPENIKKDITIFGVTGILESGGGTPTEGIKQFASIEEMNASTGNQEGDLAIVYSQLLTPVTQQTIFNNLVIPQTCILTNGFTEDEYFCAFDNQETMAIVRVESSVLEQNVVVDIAAGLITGEAQYEIENDRKTLRLISQFGFTNNKIAFDSNVQYNDRGGQSLAPWVSELLKTEQVIYEGLFEYDGTAWILKEKPVKNQEKTVTENGTVIPDTEYTGLSKVIVNVPEPDPTLTVKQFSSLDELNRTTMMRANNNMDNDLAIVYGNTFVPTTLLDLRHVVSTYFPNEVVLPSEIEDGIEYNVSYCYDVSPAEHVKILLNKTMFKLTELCLETESNSDHLYVEYESTDGKHYSIKTIGTKKVESDEITPLQHRDESYQWPNTLQIIGDEIPYEISYFMLRKDMAFQGLYRYSSANNSWTEIPRIRTLSPDNYTIAEYLAQNIRGGNV